MFKYYGITNFYRKPKFKFEVISCKKVYFNHLLNGTRCISFYTQLSAPSYSIITLIIYYRSVNETEY